MRRKANTIGIFLAVLAAALYAVNSPFSKLLLDYMPSTLMAGFLYLGAGLGMGVVALCRKIGRKDRTEEKITRADLPYTLAMIGLDIAAPIFLLLGLSFTTAANASLPAKRPTTMVSAALKSSCRMLESMMGRAKKIT